MVLETLKRKKSLCVREGGGTESTTLSERIGRGPRVKGTRKTRIRPSGNDVASKRAPTAAVASLEPWQAGTRLMRFG